MSTRTFRAVALGLLAASVHACSSDSAVGPGDAEPATLSGTLNEAYLSSIAGLGAASSPEMASATSPFSPSSCPYDAATQSFICARITTPTGVTIDRSFTLFDATGSKQSQFSATSTAAVRTLVHGAGTITFEGHTRTLDFVDDRTVSGLLSARHVLNGTGTSKFDGSVTGGTHPMAISSTNETKIENLVLPSRSNRWPGPGTMTTVGTTTFGEWPPTTLHMRAVFDGTKCVVVTFSSEDMAPYTMTIDLSNPGGAAGCTP